MAELTNVLLESGTNELEIVEFYIDETPPGRKRARTIRDTTASM